MFKSRNINFTTKGRFMCNGLYKQDMYALQIKIYQKCCVNLNLSLKVMT